MCGLLSYVSSKGMLEGAEYAGAEKLSRRLWRRGYGRRGAWKGKHVAQFHYRLPMLDIARASQPFHSYDNKQHLVYNGEIYNFQDLRSSLDYPFCTSSDTETLLALLRIKGPTYLSQIDGEFSFVFWDEDKRECIAGRDFFGVKPIYLSSPGIKNETFRYYKDEYTFSLKPYFILASEIKSVSHSLAWEEEGLRRQFCGLYEEIATTFQSVLSLPPNSFFVGKLKGEIWHCSIKRLKKNTQKKNTQSFQMAAKKLSFQLSKNVKTRLLADVDLGVYLSGGIDSQIIAYEMLKYKDSISSFTVSFEDKNYDESQNIYKYIEEQKGVKGYFLKMHKEALIYSYPHALYASELVQPYTNGAAKWWLSCFASRYVRGVLTGDGADELFCGYPSYRYLNWWEFYKKRPSEWRKNAYAIYSEKESHRPWESGLSSQYYGKDLEKSLLTLHWEHPLFFQIESLAKLFFASSKRSLEWLESIRDSIFSYLREEQSVFKRWKEYFLITHFPTHVLNIVGDRMEMANTLEGRPAFLSQNMYTMQSTLPKSYFLRGMQDKAVLRKAYKDKIGNFVKSPKKQFNAPFYPMDKFKSEFLSKKNITENGPMDYSVYEQSINKIKSFKNPMEISYGNIFLQNILAFHMLNKYLIEGKAPERDYAWEDEYIEKSMEIYK